MKRALALAFLGVQLCWTALSPATAQAQTGGDAYCIYDVSTSAFPAVTTTLRLVSSDGIAQDPPANLQLFENGVAASDVSAQKEDGPVHYIFIVDGGRSPNTALKNTVQRVIGLLADSGAFRDGLDEVTVRVLANSTANNPSARTEERLSWKSNAADLRTMLGSDILPKNSSATRGLDALKDGIDALKARIGSGAREAGVIIFITNRIESANNPVADAAGWAGQALLNHFPVFAFQANAAATNTKPVQALTPPDRYVLLTGNYDALVKAAYDRMSALRSRYTVSYTSVSPDTNTRRISIGAPNAFGACSDSDQYTVNIPTPVVSINGLPGQIQLNQETPNVPIVADITWPGGAPKTLRSASLIVNKAIRQQKQPAELGSNTGSVTFVATAADFAGSDTAEVIVEVVDSLGRSFRSSPQNIVVDRTLAQPAPPAPPEPQTTSPLLYVAVGIGALALIASMAAIVLITRRKRSSPNSGRFAGAGYAQGRPVASLTIIDGPPTRMGERVALVKDRYVLGRQKADIAFYTSAPNSTVSRVHCTITHEADSYWIVDNVSSNGTRINGHRILANERTPLHHGDTITLGDVKRNGVQLQFAVEDRTQVVRPGTLDGGSYYKTR